MDSFKKLFVVEFNRKNFLILVGEDHHFAFLEVNKEGKYSYPKYEDYKALDEIYNHFDWTKVPSFTKVSFDDTIRRAKSAFLASLMGTSFGIGFAFTATSIAHDNGYEIALESPTLLVKKVDDIKKLGIYYDNEKITREDVIKEINENSSYNDSYKKAAIMVMDLNLEKDSDADLRVYYQNMLDTGLKFISEKRMHRNGTATTRAFVRPRLKTIYFIEGVDEEVNEENLYIVLHEFNHLFHLLWDTERGVFFDDASPLHEGMTEKTIGGSCYWFEQRVVTFFMDNVDKFNYHVYNERGIDALIEELKEKYPDVDIEGILDLVKANFISNQSTKVESKDPLENIDFLDEMFKISLNNIDKKDIFRAFESFAQLLGYSEYDCYNAILNETKSDDLCGKYFTLYVNELENRGLFSRDKLKKLIDIIGETDYLVNYNGKLYAVDHETDPLENFDGTYYSGDTDIGYRYNAFAMNGKIKFKCMDGSGGNENITIDDDMIQFVFLGEPYGKGKLIKHIFEGGFSTDATLGDILTDLNAKNDLFGEKKFMSFSNGEVAMPEITDDMYVEVGQNKNGGLGLMLWQQGRLIYGTCDGLVSPTAKIPYSKYVRLISIQSGNFNFVEDIISIKGFNSIPGYVINYYMPNINIEYKEKVILDSYGMEHYSYDRVYSFRAPFKTFVDGEEVSLGGIELETDFGPDDRILTLHIAQGKDVVFGGIYENEYRFIIDIEESGCVYAEEMSMILDYFGIEPENGVYNFTSDELAQLVRNYIDEQNRLVMGEIKNAR